MARRGRYTRTKVTTQETKDNISKETTKRWSDPEARRALSEKMKRLIEERRALRGK